MGRKAFTLVELLVVIGIVGLIGTVSFPSLTKFRKTVLIEAQAQVLAAAARRAQVEALAKGRTVELPPFKFGASGYPVPGYSGTLVLSPHCKVIVSSVGRVRIE
ncbi:MAG: type II secretion system GspH family protein [Candidatus Margulisbacteria bacterium]|jgi:prepilin-type N-terminal cleavage/methylation domain-containing protein|nr:type II secretion system GspH family protein [Candidatus Margulisiibacteriota bacterium]